MTLLSGLRAKGSVAETATLDFAEFTEFHDGDSSEYAKSWKMRH